MQLLDRCIYLRYSCLKRFLKRPDASTQGHAHFIRVLADVKNIFANHIASAKIPSSNRSAKVQDASWTNMFAALDIQEDEYTAEDLPDIFVPEPSGRPPDAPTRVTFAPEPDVEELVVRMLAFFEDMHDIRDEIIALWGGYKSGEIDLITASVTTNTALELLRSSHDDVVKTVLPAFDNDLPRLMAVIYNLLISVFSRPGSRAEGPPLFQLLDDSDWVKTAIYDHLLIPLHQILGGMSDLIQDGVVPIYKPGHCGNYDPTLKFYSLPFSKRWHQSLIIMSETFTDYFLLNMMGNDNDKQVLPSSQVIGDETRGNLFFIDEIAREMNRFSTTKDLSLLPMIHCQVFIDLNFVMGSSADKGSKELKRGAADMLSTLRQRRVIEPKAPESTWHPDNEKLVSMFMAELESWATMAPATLMQKIVDGRASVRCYLFERDPMLCGLLLFRLRLKYQYLGLRLVNSFGAILATAHLLAACQHSGTLPNAAPPRWDDMGVIMDLHGKDNIFGGKYPDNVDDSLVSFLHMMGYSKEFQGAAKHVFNDAPLPSYLQSSKGKAIKIKSKSGPKGLMDHTQILPLFIGKYVRDPSAGTKFDLKALETLLSDIKADQDRLTLAESEDGIEYLGFRARGSSGRKDKLRIRRERKHRSPKFSILQLLSVLETGLAAETTCVRFDYVSMHLRCFRLLREVRLSADEYFIGKLGPRYIENDAQLPFIVGYILQYSAFSGRAAERALGVKREGRNATDVRSKRLLDATRVVREFLESTGEGSAEVDRMHL
ncbi:hypothetical protein IAU59_005319 [Kwoniella sp. CBS 9459]